MSGALTRLTVPLRRFLGHHVFSSLTRRILFLNLAALGVSGPLRRLCRTDDSRLGARKLNERCIHSIRR